MPTAACPTDHELTAFASGLLPAADMDRVAEHVQGCAVCQRQFSQLGSRGGSVLAALRADPTAETAFLPAGANRPDTIPHVGAAPGSNPTPGIYGSLPRLDSEIRELLRFRLRVMSVVTLVVFLFFILERTVEPMRHANAPREWAWADHGIMLLATLVNAVGVAVLWLRPRLGLRGLRAVEVAVFGSVTASLAGTRYTTLAAAGPGLSIEHATLLSNMAWYFTLAIYGLCIPNTWRRCAWGLGGLAAVAITATLLAARDSPVAADRLPFLLGTTGIGLFLTGSLAAFGSFKISTLQQEAFAARQEARELGQYRLTRKLGAGGMGEVWLAEHRLLKRPCAVKLLRPGKAGDPDYLRRFEREVQATARLRHPNTVEIYDYGHAADGTFYYVMEYLDGLTLDELVRRYGPLPEARAVHVLRQLCAALRAAHGVGLIHRDIKPGNVMLTPDGPPHDRVKLLDFGLVRPAAEDGATKLTQDGVAVGTPDYMSPEQVEGAAEIDGRSDLYSLGAVAYFLLAGRPPFPRGSVMKVLVAHLQEAAPPLRSVRAGVPDDLAAAVHRCLEKGADDRFAGAAELDRVLAGCGCAGRWTEDDAAAWWQGATCSDTSDGTEARTGEGVP